VIGVESNETRVDTEVRLTIRYEQDSKRFHRYNVIDPEGNVTGSLYFSKKAKIPKRVILETGG
jgi:hypothetical protein